MLRTSSSWPWQRGLARTAGGCEARLAWREDDLEYVPSCGDPAPETRARNTLWPNFMMSGSGCQMGFAVPSSYMPRRSEAEPR